MPADESMQIEISPSFEMEVHREMGFFKTNQLDQMGCPCAPLKNGGGEITSDLAKHLG